MSLWETPEEKIALGIILILANLNRFLSVRHRLIRMRETTSPNRHQLVKCSEKKLKKKS